MVVVKKSEVPEGHKFRALRADVRSRRFTSMRCNALHRPLFYTRNDIRNKKCQREVLEFIYLCNEQQIETAVLSMWCTAYKQARKDLVFI